MNFVEAVGLVIWVGLASEDTNTEAAAHEGNCESNGNRSKNNKRFGEHFFELEDNEGGIREWEGLL